MPVWALHATRATTGAEIIQIIWSSWALPKLPAVRSEAQLLVQLRQKVWGAQRRGWQQSEVADGSHGRNGAASRCKSHHSSVWGSSPSKTNWPELWVRCLCRGGRKNSQIPSKYMEGGKRAVDSYNYRFTFKIKSCTLPYLFTLFKIFFSPKFVSKCYCK